MNPSWDSPSYTRQGTGPRRRGLFYVALSLGSWIAAALVERWVNWFLG